MICRATEMSFSAFQKSSSMLMLVLWPAGWTERLTTKDFMEITVKAGAGSSHCGSGSQ